MPLPLVELNALVDATEQVVLDAEAVGKQEGDRVRVRLRNSVLRPLRSLTPNARSERNRVAPVAASGEPSATLGDSMWELTRVATALLVDHPHVPELAEAAAALQDLAIRLVDQTTAEDRVAELEDLQRASAAQVQVASDGPYLVTNAQHVSDWLGQEIAVRPLMALCRCGASQLKPLCDGSHARLDFSGAKDPNRVSDHRDTYVGQQVTILDNRGTCQHAGYCTDRLASVFRLHDEPFVAPSGGRMDEIIRAVRDCPSGALSYAIEDVEARESVDYHHTREPTIEVAKDGPYRVIGGMPLISERGDPVERNEGASLEHYALCRCGHSQNKPFCSGMHYYIDFRDPIAPPDYRPTIFEWAGGLPALLRMTRRFYETHVPQDPLLAPLFATMSADHPQRVARWLAEVFGGPSRYSAEHGGYTRMLSQHVGKCLTEEQRERWVTLLLRSAREAGLPNDAEFRSAFEAYIEWGSRLAVENSQTGANPPEHMPMPHWDWNTAAGPPGSRSSALAPPREEEPSIELPKDNETVSFERHIKPLFRATDQRSMQFAFDLWSYDDVSHHADAILARLRAGTMPCDGPWPELHIDVFERWAHGDKDS